MVIFQSSQPIGVGFGGQVWQVVGSQLCKGSDQRWGTGPSVPGGTGGPSRGALVTSRDLCCFRTGVMRLYIYMYIYIYCVYIYIYTDILWYMCTYIYIYILCPFMPQYLIQHSLFGEPFSNLPLSNRGTQMALVHLGAKCRPHDKWIFLWISFALLVEWATQIVQTEMPGVWCFFFNPCPCKVRNQHEILSIW